MQVRAKYLVVGSVAAILFVAILVAYWIHRHNAHGPAGKHIDLVMHDASALNPERSSSPYMHCSIQFPQGYPAQRIREEHELYAMGSTGGISIVLVELRSDMNFDSYVQAMRSHDLEYGDAKIDVEGPTTLSGLSGYVIIRQGRFGSSLTKYREVYLKASNNRCFALSAFAKAEDWNAVADSFESSMSTFEVASEGR